MEEPINPNTEKIPSPEELASKLSLILIKPENNEKTVLFPHILANHGLETEQYKVMITEDVLSGLYKGIESWPAWVQKATRDHLLGKELSVFLVKGNSDFDGNVLDKVLQLVGTETSITTNDKNSMRAVFYGEKRTYSDEQNEPKDYWENGLHRPKNPDELIENLDALNLKNEALKFIAQD